MIRNKLVRMELSLSDDERALLQELLSSALRDLRMEVVETDNAAYRHGLQAREAKLWSILDRIGGILDLG